MLRKIIAMKRNQDNRTIQERACDLEKVVTFAIMSTIKKYYADVDALKKIYTSIVNGTCDSDVQVKFCSRFKCLTRNEYRKILGQIEIDGKRHWLSINDVKQYFSKWFHYQRHFNKRYKSKKTFAVHGYWYIDFDVVERWINFDDVYNTKSNFYTKLQHIFIDSIILKGKHMTKKEKEQYEKEYAEGKHMLTLEEHLKDEQKKQRSLDKRRMTIAKKAAKQTLTEYAALQTKANTLEVMNAEKDEQIKEQQQKIDELRRKLQINAESPKQINTTSNVESEIPAAWTSWEGHYDYEGPNVEKFRSDGTQLEPKCMPSKWMASSDLFDFREGKMDEDEFERLWQIYVMTDKEKDSGKMTDESRAIAPSTAQWSQDKLDDQIRKCDALVDDGDLDDADIAFVVPHSLQKFIDKHYISLNEANWIAKLYKEDFKLKEAKSGFSLEDRKTHLNARKIIVKQIIKEINHILSDDDLKRLRMMIV